MSSSDSDMRAMKISLDIELKDIPGQLVHALKPISELGGNIISVLHHHNRKTPLGNIPVQVVFEIDERNVETLVQRLKRRGVSVLRVGRERLRSSKIVILIGHIVHSDIRDLIDSIDSTGFAEVVKLSLEMPAIDMKSSASLTISAVNEDKLNEAMEILRDVARKKGIMMISPI